MTSPRFNRRDFVLGTAGLVGAAALAACDNKSSPSASSETVTSTANSTLPPTDPSVVVPPSAVSGAPATFIDHGNPAVNTVAFTFHLSGEAHLITELLDLLKSRSVAITAFAVGSWITAHPAITKRLVADGHELANHTENHLSMNKLTRQQLSDEIVQCGQAILPFIGSIGRWFRPSATVVPKQLILEETGRAGYPISVGYDVDSMDYKDPGSSAIVANVKNAIHPGAIVSFHFGHQGTIEAFPRILDHLAKVNLQPVTVGTLLG